MPILVTPPKLRDAGLNLITGEVALRVTRQMPFNGDIIVVAWARGTIVAGEFYNSDQTGPLEIPSTPPGDAVEIVVLPREWSEGRQVPAAPLSRTVSVPLGASVAWDDLVDTVPIGEGGDVVPAWASDVLTARDETLQLKADIELLIAEGGVGLQGKSAYQVAVDNGFVGTEAQWLASLGVNVTSVTATGLAAGASPTVTLSGPTTGRTLNFGIPAGATGAAAGISSVSVTTLAAGATPTVTLGGTSTARTFAFGLPQGAVVDNKVYYNGTSWQTRASRVPVGYTGPMEYFSAPYVGAPAPTDRLTNDIWTYREA